MSSSSLLSSFSPAPGGGDGVIRGSAMRNAVRAFLAANGYRQQPCGRVLASLQTVFAAIAADSKKNVLRRFNVAGDSYQAMVAGVAQVPELLQSLGYVQSVNKSGSPMLILLLPGADSDTDGSDAAASQLELMRTAVAWGIETLEIAAGDDDEAGDDDGPSAASPIAPVKLPHADTTGSPAFSSSFSSSSSSPAAPARISFGDASDDAKSAASPDSWFDMERRRWEEAKRREQEDQQLAAHLFEQDRMSDAERRRKEQEDAALAATLQRDERKRMQQLREEEEASLALALELNQQFMDEKFAHELERLNRLEEERRHQAEAADAAIAEQLDVEERQKYEEERRKRAEAIGEQPGYWTEPLSGAEKYRRVPLSEDHHLYEAVYERFSKCGHTVLSIEYVQSPQVFRRYHGARAASKIQEVYRFHGTPMRNVDGICEQGLLTSVDVAGRGTTIWSAEDPTVSVGYSRKGPDSTGRLAMFLCRVLSNTASISTVQDSAHIWPEFLIIYRINENNAPAGGPRRAAVRSAGRCGKKK